MPYSPFMLPLITLRGTPFEIGRAFGQQARARISQHLANQQSIMAAMRPHDPGWWRREVRTHLAPYESLAPHVVDEMHGLARGADLTFEEILLLNVRDELTASRPP